MTPVEVLLAAVAAPVVITIVVVCLREPMRVALPIFAALIPFGGALSLGGSRYASLSSLIGVLLGLGLILQLITTRRSAPRITAGVPVWLLLLGVAVATALWSDDQARTINGVIVLASLVLVYVFTVISHADRTIVRRTENALLIGSAIAVGYGIFQLLFLGGLPTDDPISALPEGGRFGNGFLGPNIQSVALVLPLTIALGRMLSAQRRSARNLSAVLAALMLVGILLTASRTGSLVAAIAMLTMAFSGPRSARRRVLTYLGVAAIAGALVWVYQPWGVAARTFETASSSSGRTDIWRVAAAACTEYCATGSGWSTFAEVYAETQASVEGARVLVGAGAYEAHNIWLLVGIELGFLGLLLLCLGLAISLLEAVRLPRNLRGPVLGALVATIVAGMFLSSLEFKYFWMALIMVSLYRNQHLAESEPVRVPPQPPSGVAEGRHGRSATSTS